MQRADGLDFDAGGLLQQRLYLRAVFAHNVGEIPARIGQPLGFKIIFIGKQPAVERAEGAESIRGEEHLVRHIVGHHRFRPVNHRGHDEGEGMAAGAQRVALLDDERAAVNLKVEELTDHDDGLCVAHHRHLRMAQHQLGQRRRVVGLHVVDDYIVEHFAVQRVLQIFKEQAADGGVYRVHQHGLLILHEVGVVRNAARDREHVFKQSQTAVAAAHPDQIFFDILDAIQSQSLLPAGKIMLMNKVYPPGAEKKHKAGKVLKLFREAEIRMGVVVGNILHNLAPQAEIGRIFAVFNPTAD